MEDPLLAEAVIEWRHQGIDPSPPLGHPISLRYLPVQEGEGAVGRADPLGPKGAWAEPRTFTTRQQGAVSATSAAPGQRGHGEIEQAKADCGHRKEDKTVGLQSLHRHDEDYAKRYSVSKTKWKHPSCSHLAVTRKLEAGI